MSYVPLDAQVFYWKPLTTANITRDYRRWFRTVYVEYTFYNEKQMVITQRVTELINALRRFPKNMSFN